MNYPPDYPGRQQCLSRALSLQRRKLPKLIVAKNLVERFVVGGGGHVLSIADIALNVVAVFVFVELPGPNDKRRPSPSLPE